MGEHRGGTPGIRRVAQVAVPVAELAPAVEFYRDVLGLEFLFDAGTMAFFRCGELRLMLAEPEPEVREHSSILYFEVDDVEAATATLEARGVPFREGPRRVHRASDHELWMSFFTDPAGNVMALTGTRPHAAAAGS